MDDLVNDAVQKAKAILDRGDYVKRGSRQERAFMRPAYASVFSTRVEAALKDAQAAGDDQAVKKAEAELVKIVEADAVHLACKVTCAARTLEAASKGKRGTEAQRERNERCAREDLEHAAAGLLEFYPTWEEAAPQPLDFSMAQFSEADVPAAAALLLESGVWCRYCCASGSQLLSSCGRKERHDLLLKSAGCDAKNNACYSCASNFRRASSKALAEGGSACVERGTHAFGKRKIYSEKVPFAGMRSRVLEHIERTVRSALFTGAPLEACRVPRPGAPPPKKRSKASK